MSTGRGRSWRPEKKRGGRASRHRTMAFLAVVLATLIAVLVVPPIFQEPPFRFVSMVASDHVLDPSGLPVFLTSAASSSGRMLKTVFEKLNELNDHHVMKPRTASSLTKLKEVVRPGETLLLYCGLETVVRCNDDAVFVQLLGSGNPSEIPFSDLLETLEGIKPARVVLLMDLVRRESGLANGRLGDDVLHLIEVAVEEASINDLVVICSSGFGERSWEYFESSEPSDVANVAPPAGDGRPRNNDWDSDIFSGTVFGHFVRQAFIDGRTTDVDEFHKYLREQVATWVETNYGEKQSVMLFPQEPRILGDRLLVNVEWPSASDLADSEARVETAAGDSESIDASKSSEQIAETDKPDAEETPTAKLDKLHMVRRRLQEAGEAVAATPAEWMEFNAALLAAEMAILHDDLAAYATMHDLAQENIDRIADHKNSLQPTGTEADLSEWILASVANPEIEAASAEMFELAFQDDVSGEKLSRLPRELRSSGPERGAFVRRFVDHLRQVADSTRPEDIQKQIAVCARFIQELPERGWPMQDWPNELLTIAEVLVADDDAVWQAQALEPLLSLIELRKQVLDAATGKLDNGASMRRHVWHQIRDDVLRLLTGLTAAERWLTLGPPGLKKAQSTLDKVASEWGGTVGQIHQEQQLVAIRDRQRTDLPILVQFLAQQQEEVPLRKGELQDAIALAEASESEIRSHFPHGLLGQPNMHSKDIDAMFALTRDLTENEDAVTPHDLVHQKCLIDYVLGRRGRSELLSVSERRRLFALPTFGLSSEEVETSRGIPVGALTDKGGGPPAAAGQLKRTGLWVSFWSIRLLEAISGVQQKDLWQEWKLLVKSLAENEQDRQKLAQARSQLASLLQTAWYKQHVSLANSSGPTIFVDNDEVRKVLAADVAQRHAAGGKHQGAYKEIHDALKLEVTDRLGKVEASPPSHSEATFNDKNDAEISVDTEGADFLYVSTGAIQLQRDGVLDEENDWYRIDSPSATEQLIFHSRADVTAPVEVYLAFTNEHHVVFRKQRVVLHPDPDNQWAVEFLAVNEEKRTKQELIEGRLELVPTTRNPKDGKDIPLSYIVRLVQLGGVATRVRVQAFDSKGVTFWETGQILDLDPQTKSVEVPLRPAVTATPPPISKAPAKDFDVLHGFRLEITPEGLKDPTTKRINIQPVLLSAEKLVRRPEPTFDGSGKLTIRIARQSTAAFGGLPPVKIPAEVHFSPALAELLGPGNDLTPIPNVAAGEEGNVLTYTFRNEIVQAFRDDDFVQDDNDLEFSVSVAGIPYAWHWRLYENDAPELLLDDEPTVRVELNQTNRKDVVPVADSPTYLFGENWKDVRLDVRAHIHGGQFDHRDHQWQLDIKRLNEGMSNTSRPMSILSEPIKLGSHHHETIRIASGKNHVWNFSTHTELHGPGDLSIIQIGNVAGRYKLIGQLKRIDSDKTIEHETQLVFDDTPPVVTVEVDPGSANSYSVLKPLKGRIVAKDPESEIAGIRAGFSVEDLVDVNLAGEFEFSAAMLPKILPSKEDQQVPHKLYVEVTNHAGLTETIPVRITFLRKASTMAKASDAVKNGKVIFEWNTAMSYTVTLRNSKGAVQDEVEGTRRVEFSDVPPGRYTISWVRDGSTGNGKKTFNVKSKETKIVDRVKK